MPHFNFKPAVTYVNFIRNQRGLEEDNHITEVALEPYDERKGPDVFELSIEIKLSGLDMLINPMNKFLIEEMHSEDISSFYEPFYIYVVTYTQRGQRDILVHGVRSQYISEEMLKEKSIEIMSFIGKFRNDEHLFPEGKDKVNYDFVTHIYFVKVFYSNEPINNEDELEMYMWEPSFELFKTKIPIKLNLLDSDANG